MKLVTRLKKIEEEMSSLKNQCRELLTAKQVCVREHSLTHTRIDLDELIADRNYIQFSFIFFVDQSLVIFVFETFWGIILLVYLIDSYSFVSSSISPYQLGISNFVHIFPSTTTEVE